MVSISEGRSKHVAHGYKHTIICWQNIDAFAGLNSGRAMDIILRGGGQKSYGIHLLITKKVGFALHDQVPLRGKTYWKIGEKKDIY